MMTSPLPLHRLTAFLSQGSTAQTPSPLQLHLLRGWKESTLLSYDSAVRKFRKFLVESGQDTWILPASPEDFYNFCFWAGRTEAEDKAQEITSRTVKKYLFGLQAWHTFHDQPYPTVTKSRVVVLLRACSRQDALRPERPLKSPVTEPLVATLPLVGRRIGRRQDLTRLRIGGFLGDGSPGRSDLRQPDRPTTLAELPAMRRCGPIHTPMLQRNS